MDSQPAARGQSNAAEPQHVDRCEFEAAAIATGCDEGEVARDSAADAELELEGELLMATHMYGVMESAPGLKDVYLGNRVMEALGAVTAGSVIRVRAVRQEPGFVATGVVHGAVVAPMSCSERVRSERELETAGGRADAAANGGAQQEHAAEPLAQTCDGMTSAAAPADSGNRLVQQIGKETVARVAPSVRVDQTRCEGQEMLDLPSSQAASQVAQPKSSAAVARAVAAELPANIMAKLHALIASHPHGCTCNQLMEGGLAPYLAEQAKKHGVATISPLAVLMQIRGMRRVDSGGRVTFLSEFAGRTQFRQEEVCERSAWAHQHAWSQQYAWVQMARWQYARTAAYQTSWQHGVSMPQYNYTSQQYNHTSQHALSVSYSRTGRQYWGHPAWQAHASSTYTFQGRPEPQVQWQQAIAVSKPLLETVVNLLRQAGGAMAVNALTTALYQCDPSAKEVLRAVGGLKAFCTQYSWVIEFTPRGTGYGVQDAVRLRVEDGTVSAGGMLDGVAEANHLSDEDDGPPPLIKRSTPSPPGSPRTEGGASPIAGRLSTATRDGGQFESEPNFVELEGKIVNLCGGYGIMESATGLKDVYLGRSVLRALGEVKVGDVVRVRAVRDDPGYIGVDAVRGVDSETETESGEPQPALEAGRLEAREKSNDERRLEGSHRSGGVAGREDESSSGDNGSCEDEAVTDHHQAADEVLSDVERPGDGEHRQHAEVRSVALNESEDDAAGENESYLYQEAMSQSEDEDSDVLELEGKMVRICGGYGIMESAPGVNDVYLGRSVLRALENVEVGDVVRVRVVRDDPGFIGVEVVPGMGKSDVSDHGTVLQCALDTPTEENHEPSQVQHHVDDAAVGEREGEQTCDADCEEGRTSAAVAGETDVAIKADKGENTTTSRAADNETRTYDTECSLERTQEREDDAGVEAAALHSTDPRHPAQKAPCKATVAADLEKLPLKQQSSAAASAAAEAMPPKLRSKIHALLAANPTGCTSSQMMKGAGLGYFLAVQAQKLGVKTISPISVLKQIPGVRPGVKNGRVMYMAEFDSDASDAASESEEETKDLVDLQGKLVTVNAVHGIMESAPGVQDVYVGLDVLAQLGGIDAIGCVLRVRAKRSRMALTRWEATAALSVSMADERAAEVGMDKQEESAGVQGNLESAALNSLRTLLQERGGVLGAQEVTAELYRRKPSSKEVVRGAGGLKEFCARHNNVLEFVHDGSSKGGQGGVRLVQFHRQDRQPPCIEASNTMRVQVGASSAESTSQAVAAGLLPRPDAAEEEDLAESNKIMDRQTATELNLIGKLSARFREHALMESSPGVADVRIPRELLDRHPALDVGARLSVWATKSQAPQDTCMYIALEILDVELLLVGTLVALPSYGILKSDRENEAVFLPPHVLAKHSVRINNSLSVLATREPGTHEGYKYAFVATQILDAKPAEVHLVGTVVGVQGECALMESAGACNVLIPPHVLEPHSHLVSKGTILSVRAEARSCGFMAAEIMCVRGSTDDRGTAHVNARDQQSLPKPPQTTKTRSAEGGLAPADDADSEVLSALVKLLQDVDGCLEGGKLPKLYAMHARARQVLKAAGGVKGFCDRHHLRLKFVSDGGAGKIMLKGFTSTKAAHSNTAAGAPKGSNRFGLLADDDEDDQDGDESSSSESESDGSDDFHEQSQSASRQEHGAQMRPSTASGQPRANAARAGAHARPQSAHVADQGVERALWHSRMPPLLSSTSEANLDECLGVASKLLAHRSEWLRINRPSLSALSESLDSVQFGAIAHLCASVFEDKAASPGRSRGVRAETTEREQVLCGVLSVRHPAQHVLCLAAAETALFGIRERDEVKSEDDRRQFAKISEQIDSIINAICSCHFQKLDEWLAEGPEHHARNCALALLIFSLRPALKVRMPLIESHLPTRTPTICCTPFCFEVLPIARDHRRPWGCHRCGHPDSSHLDDLEVTQRNSPFEEQHIQDQWEVAVSVQQNTSESGTEAQASHVESLYARLWGLDSCTADPYAGAAKVLLRCIRTEDVAMLEFFLVRDASVLVRLNWDWSWMPLFHRRAGLELVLLTDAQAAQRGGKGKLYPVLFKAIMSLFNACVKAKVHLHEAKEFMASFIVRVCTVHEFAVEDRIQLAVTTTRNLKPLETKYKLFSSPPPNASRSAKTALVVAIEACRPPLVAEVLGWGEHMVDSCIGFSSDGLPPLHRVCMLEPPAYSFSGTLYNLLDHPGKTDFLSFRMGGFAFNIELSEEQRHDDTTGFCITKMTMEDAVELGADGEVPVQVQLSVVGTAINIGGRVAFKMSHESANFLLPFSGDAASFKVKFECSVGSPPVHNGGRKRVRSAEEFRRDQEVVIQLLLNHSADVDLKDRSGRLAWTVAVEKQLPRRITDLLLPRNSVQALNEMADAKDSLRVAEALMLAEALPAGEPLDVHLAGFMRSNTASDAAVVELVRQVLRRDVATPALIAAVEQAVRVRDWEVLDLVLSRVPPTARVPVSLQLHDVVGASKNELVRKLLELGADAELKRDKQPGRGETPLHVACRFSNKAGVELLLANGASLSTRDTERGDTPLHVACQTSGTSAAPIVKLLLAEGADHAAVNRRKLRPMDLTKDKEVCKLMQAHASAEDAKKSASSPKKSKQAPVEKSKPAPVECKNQAPVTEVAPPVHAPAERAELAAKHDVVLTYQERLAAAEKAIENLQAELKASEVDPDAVSAPQDFNELASAADPVPEEQRAELAPMNPSSSSDPRQHIHNHYGACDPSPGVEAVVDAHVADGAGREGVEPIVHEDVGDAAQNADENASVITLEGQEWDLRCTREFKEVLFSRDMRSAGLLESTVKNLERLARGEQGTGLMKLLQGTPKSMRIFEAPCKTFNDGPRFLFQFAVDYSPRIKGFSDTIRLWKLCLQHDDVNKAMNNIVLANQRGRQSAVKRTLRPSFGGSCVREGRRFPRTYEVAEGVDAEAVRELATAEAARFEQLVAAEDEDAGQEGAGLVLYTPPAVAAANSFNVLKFYALNAELLNLAAAKARRATDSSEAVGDTGPELPFIPDQNEDSIINTDVGSENSSLLLIGRSGTGKTSIALGKLWNKYHAWHSKFEATADAHDDSVPRYHQVFVTANKVLRDQVRKSFLGMAGVFEGNARQAPTEYPPTLRNVPEEMFPLFLTSAEWLSMLDGTLPEPFFARHPDGSLKEPVESAFHEEYGMLEMLPDEDEAMSDDDDWDLQSACGAPSEIGERRDEAGADDSGQRRKEIDSRTFHKVLWPRISARMPTETKSLSASAVFLEIHSYIKGSHVALDKPRGWLSREEYLHLPTKMAPNFQGLSANEGVEDLPGDRRGTRDVIYDLFLAYEEEKKGMNAYDISDFIHHIWTQLQRRPYEATPIDSIFVDETQDFTQAELRLFIRTCRDKNDMFFSGDTCQTIQSGVGFRFQELRSLFKAEQDQQMLSSVQLPAHLRVSVPKVSVLSVNYRTHNGILSCAAAMVDLLKAFFPGTIDILPRENGFFEGPKPILLPETKVDDAALLIVGSDKKASQIEFGAHQVILVRSQEAKKALPREFDGCLAMTVLESKGLEFDDVFLWSFLSDSKADKEWRVVLSYLAQQDAAVVDELEASRSAEKNRDVSGMLRPLEFSEHQHLALCEELKQLYTAITRARVRVIIYEQDEVKRAPMFFFLQKQRLVEVLSYFSAQSHTPLAVQTSAEEWRKQGFNLRDNGMLPLAAKCFAKAGDRTLENEVTAQHLANSAVRESDPRKRRAGFFEAAERFLAAGLGCLLSAAKCFVEAGELRLAASLFRLCPGAQNLNKAVRCYRQLGDTSTAIELLLEHGRIRRALEILKREGNAEAALQILDAHPDFVPPDDLSADTFVEAAIAKLTNTAVSDTEHSQALRDRLLAKIQRLAPERELHHLRRCGFREELVQRLVSLGRLVAAAKVLEDDHKIRQAAELLENASAPTAESVQLCSELFLSVALDPSSADSAACRSKAVRLLEIARSMLRDETADASQDEKPRPARTAAQSQRQQEAEAVASRLLLLHIDQATNARSKPQDAKAGLQHLQQYAEDASMAPLVSCWIRSEILKATAKAEAAQSAQMPSWLWDLPTLLSSFEGLLRLMVQVQQSDRKANMQDYFPCEHLFGFRRQSGMCSIRKVDKALLYRLLGLEESSLAPETEQAMVDNQGFVIVNAASHFQPALTHFLSCKRLELIDVALTKLEESCAAADLASACDSDSDRALQVRWAMALLWCCATRSKLEHWHARSAKLFLPADGQLKQRSAIKVRGYSYWAEKKSKLQVTLSGLLVSLAAEGMPNKIDVLFPAMPRSMLSDVRSELQAHAMDTIKDWRKKTTMRRSAWQLCTALCVSKSCGFDDTRRTLAPIVAEAADAPEWRPPLVQSGIPELWNAVWAEKANKPLACAVWRLRFLAVHVPRDPPMDTWSWLETAMAEAAVALSMPTNAAGAAHKTVTYLPLSLARRVRAVRAKEDAKDAETLLLNSLRAASKCIEVAAAADSRITIPSKRAAAAFHAMLLNFVLYQAGPLAEVRQCWWHKVAASALGRTAEAFPPTVVTSLPGWSAEKALPVLEGGPALVVSPACLSAALRADGDSLVKMQGDASSQAVALLSDHALRDLDASFQRISSISSHGLLQRGVNVSTTAVEGHALASVADDGMVLDVSDLGSLPPLVTEDGLDQDFEREQEAVAVLCKYLRRHLDLMQSGLLNLSAEASGGKLDEALSSPGQADDDPFQRRERYRMYYEKPVSTEMGFRMAMYNNMLLLFDSSSQDYFVKKESFNKFVDLYHRVFVPPLTQADLANLALREFAMKGPMIPTYVDALHSIYGPLVHAVVKITEILDDVDQHCKWAEELESKESLLAETTSWMVMEVLPRVQDFVQHLRQSAPEHIYLPTAGFPAAVHTFLPPMPQSGQDHAQQEMMPPIPTDIAIVGSDALADQGATPWIPDDVRALSSALPSPQDPSAQAQPPPQLLLPPDILEPVPTQVIPGRLSEATAAGRSNSALEPIGAQRDDHQFKVEPGIRCQAIFYADRRLYLAKVLYQTKLGWKVEFQGWERHRTGRQDTYVKDLFPLDAQPTEMLEAEADDMEQGQDEGEELGWTAVKTRSRQRGTYHRFGFQQRQKRW